MKLNKENEMDIEEAYRVMQEASGIKAGDMVRVLRKAESYKMGWANSWCEKMDDSIGECFMVDGIPLNANIGIRLRHGIGRFTFPFFVLEIVEPTKTIELRYICDGEDVTDDISEETKRNLVRHL